MSNHFLIAEVTLQQRHLLQDPSVIAVLLPAHRTELRAENTVKSDQIPLLKHPYSKMIISLTFFYL